jgi:hypothetical protein
MDSQIERLRRENQLVRVQCGHCINHDKPHQQGKASGTHNGGYPGVRYGHWIRCLNPRTRGASSCERLTSRNAVFAYNQAGTKGRVPGPSANRRQTVASITRPSTVSRRRDSYTDNAFAPSPTVSQSRNSNTWVRKGAQTPVSTLSTIRTVYTHASNKLPGRASQPTSSHLRSSSVQDRRSVDVREPINCFTRHNVHEAIVYENRWSWPVTEKHAMAPTGHGPWPVGLAASLGELCNNTI